MLLLCVKLEEEKLSTSQAITCCHTPGHYLANPRRTEIDLPLTISAVQFEVAVAELDFGLPVRGRHVFHHPAPGESRTNQIGARLNVKGDFFRGQAVHNGQRHLQIKKWQ